MPLLCAIKKKNKKYFLNILYINKFYFVAVAKRNTLINASRRNKRYKFLHSIQDIANVDNKYESAAAIHCNKELVFIPGQRGKNLLLYQNYTYSKNNQTSNTIYWKCRIIHMGIPCNARITTFQQENGLYNVALTKPVHNHPPSKRLINRLKIAKFEQIEDY